MEKRNIIVLGASAGGFDVIKQIVGNLPTDLKASIFVVWHMSAFVTGVLPDVLNRQKTLPAANAIDGEPIVEGRIYVAPPDHHLLIEKDRVRVTHGPKENRFRPAVDPLFRSAAYAYGPRVIGVILSGALDDGTAGLWTIKEYGGMAVVQDPSDAEVPSMPESALEAVAVDHKIPVSEMAALLTTLVDEFVPEGNGKPSMLGRQTKMEIDIAMQKDERFKKKLLGSAELTPYTCPECHGVLAALTEGGRVRFRCHTGHAYSADSLLASITENIEETLWMTARSLQEAAMLLNNMGDHFAEVNHPKTAAKYFLKAKDAENRAALLKDAIYGLEPLTAETDEPQPAKKQVENE